MAKEENKKVLPHIWIIPAMLLLLIIIRFSLFGKELEHLEAVSYKSQELIEKSSFSFKRILTREKQNAIEITAFSTISWDVFNQYLRQKTVYPETENQSGIEGRIEISFLIGKDGEFQNLHIIKGIGWGCDEEALRIVSQIPKWMLAAKIDTQQYLTMSLPIHFSLN